MLFRKKNSKRKINRELLDIIKPIISDNHFKELKKMRHHVFFNRYEHLINVATISFKMAKFLKADINTCVMAAILHDFYFAKCVKH